jgi:hypothetical protein
MLLSSCILTSYHPWFPEKESILVPGIEGQWENTEEELVMRFQKHEKSSYILHYAEKDKRARYRVRIARIEGKYCCDFMPLAAEINDFHRPFLRPLHSLMVLELSGEKLKITPPNYDWFDKKAKSGQLAGLRHERFSDNRLVLTSPTEDLRKFLSEHLGDKGFLGKSLDLVRKK